MDEVSAHAGRMLARLVACDGLLAQPREGGAFGVYAQGDRRRRALGRISPREVKGLLTAGAIAPHAQGGYVATAAGKRRVRRSAAAPAGEFLAQHAPLGPRHVMDGDGDARTVLGVEPRSIGARLACWFDARGRVFFTPAEVEAASALRADWEFGQIGLTPTADLRAPPRGAAPRGPGGREGALAGGLDARARVATALSGLAPPLRQVVTAIVLEDCAVSVVERTLRWPPRSAKVALKMALAQLAAHRERRARPLESASS